MRTRVSTHGPDALVRIRVAAARAAGVALGDTVALRVEDGRLVIEQVRDSNGAHDIALALLTARGVTRLGVLLGVQRHVAVEDVVEALDALVTAGKARIEGTTARSRRYTPVSELQTS